MSLYGPGIYGSNPNIDECTTECDCIVCGRHFVAYTGIQRWPYVVRADEMHDNRRITRRICCSWSCLCCWRREHTIQIPTDGESPDERDGCYAYSYKPKRLKELCESRGINPKTLAYRCGLTSDTVRSLMNGTQTPRWRTLRKLAYGLKIDPHDLM